MRLLVLVRGFCHTLCGVLSPLSASLSAVLGGHLVWREWQFAGSLCVCRNATTQGVVQLGMSVVQDGVCGKVVSQCVHCLSSQCNSSHSVSTLAMADE